jgi:RNA polymerase-interacting CarD/CdnL/TRCF family regulator
LSGWRFLFFTEKALEVPMNFREGDTVMHWTYGLGKVIELDERALFGQNTLYYAVKVGDLMVWVPADDRLGSRLRPPTSKVRANRSRTTARNERSCWWDC